MPFNFKQRTVDLFPMWKTLQLFSLNTPHCHELLVRDPIRVYMSKIATLAYRHFEGLYLRIFLHPSAPVNHLAVSDLQKLLKIPKRNLKSFWERSSWRRLFGTHYQPLSEICQHYLNSNPTSEPSCSSRLSRRSSTPDYKLCICICFVCSKMWRDVCGKGGWERGVRGQWVGGGRWGSGEEIERGTENGVFRGLVFWVLTSQLCVCALERARVCACVCAIFLTKCNDCVLVGDCGHARAPLCVCVTFMCCVCVCVYVCGGVCRERVLVLISMYRPVSLTLENNAI